MCVPLEQYDVSTHLQIKIVFEIGLTSQLSLINTSIVEEGKEFVASNSGEMFFVRPTAVQGNDEGNRYATIGNSKKCKGCLLP